MVSTLYLLTFLASLAVLADLVIRHRRIVTNVLMLCLMVTLTNLGRYLMSTADNLQIALLGNLLLFTCGCFCPLFVLLILSEYSRVPVPNWLVALLSVSSLAVILLALTGQSSGLFYSGTELVVGPDFSYLLKTFGPLHFLHPLLLMGYFLSILWLMLRAHRKTGQVPFAMVSISVILGLLAVSAYVQDRIFDYHVSFISIAFFLAMLMLMHSAEKLTMYDLPTNIASSIEAMNEIAYIEFDGQYRCVGHNQRARELFPDIEQTCPIGQPIETAATPLYTKVLSWMLHRGSKDQRQITLGARTYDVKIRNIPYRRNPCVGYLLELVDRTAERNWLSTVENYNEQLKIDVAQATSHIAHMRDMMVVGMASMVESRDDSTGNHIKRTYQVMRTFSEHLLPYREELGMTTEFLEMVTRAAPMHDLGKIAISDSVLKKAGAFTQEDFEVMKQHPELGAKIVRHILTGVEDEAFVQIAENVAHYHHERWDGTGYPRGLKGPQIPLEARLMALPDVCDAMLSKRCYKEAQTFQQVFSDIEANLGTHFDPVLGKHFIACRPEIEEMYRKWYEEDGDDKQLHLQPALQDHE